MKPHPTPSQPARELAERILKHVVQSYYPNNVWFTNITPVLEQALDRARQEGWDAACDRTALISVRTPAGMMGMGNDQRMYGWHEVMDALGKAMVEIRALKGKSP